MLKFKASHLAAWAADHYEDFYNLEFSLYGNLLKIYEHETLPDGKDGYSICYFFVKHEDGNFYYIEAYDNSRIIIGHPELSQEFLEKVSPLQDYMNENGKQSEILARVVCSDLLFAIRSLSIVSEDNSILIDVRKKEGIFNIVTSQCNNKEVSIVFRKNDFGGFCLNQRE